MKQNPEPGISERIVSHYSKYRKHNPETGALGSTVSHYSYQLHRSTEYEESKYKKFVVLFNDSSSPLDLEAVQ